MCLNQFSNVWLLSTNLGRHYTIKDPKGKAVNFYFWTWNRFEADRFSLRSDTVRINQFVFPNPPFILIIQQFVYGGRK